MKLAIAAAGALVVAWLGLWATDTGLLMYSSETGVLKTRDCRYLVGITLVRKYAPLAQRCRLISKGAGPLV